MNNYLEELRIQRRNLEKSEALKTYFSFIYSLIEREMHDADNILEVGSGTGLSKLFIGRPIHRTDFFDFPQYGVVGQVDMNALPFASETFDAVLAVDSIHHSNTPEIALSELIRIVGQGKRIIIFEPYVSLFSFFFYKLFHSENTSWDFRTKKSADLSILKHKKPGDGDQGVSKYLISIFSGNEFPHEVRVQYLSWISFFLTGGINSPLPISGKIISSVIRFESRFSQKIMKLIASRVLISIKKKS